jgi:O-acetyl-ADP-ribose deacetylase (regulator of RNase III)
MIHYTVGNVLESDAQALINTVNTEGVMGKGIALQFKKAFPANFKHYEQACKTKELAIGNLFVYRDSNLHIGEKLIINFPTKTTWRKPSEYTYIEAGLEDLLRVIKVYHIQSVALPPLGAGNGGLIWERVKQIIEKKLSTIDIDIYVYEPSVVISKAQYAERVKLTEARALLLYVLYDLVKHEEFVSVFSCTKICYFLQQFGAQKYLKLDFKPNFYGPYADKVRFLVSSLNGSYVMGYSDMDKKPFEPLSIVMNGYDSVYNYIEQSPELRNIAQNTTSFLKGFYSDFSLELLSSINYIMETHKTGNKNIIVKELQQWNTRKQTIFSDERYVDIALRHLSSLHSNK